MLPHISPTLLLYIVLGVILVGGLAPFVYKLFVLYIKLPFNNWGKPMKAEPNFVDVSLEDVPKETLTKVAQIAQMFAAFGFKAASHARADNNLANTESYQSIWLSPESGTTATLFVIRIRIRDQIRDNISCGFVTEFDDGTSLVISNSKYGTIFVRDPLCDSLHWPRFQKLDVMFELHRRRLEQLRGSRKIFLPAPGEALAHSKKRNRETMKRQVAQGYFWHDQESFVYRRTFKGSFLMTWKLLWPWKQIRARRNNRRLRDALASAGMAPPEAYAPPSRKPPSPVSSPSN